MDDRSKKGHQDDSRIDVNQTHELRYWSEKFAISADKLKEIVKKVGTSVKDVEKAIAGQ